MQILIKPAENTFLPAYTDLLQRTYQQTYTAPELGLTPECFSKEIFTTVDTQEYLASNIQNTDQQQCWLAFDREKLLGAITIKKKNDECELTGFYVDPDYQGQGIGKMLWQKALPFTENKDIVLDIYAHNIKTIEMYKRWGFVEDKEKGTLFRHWPEWPEGLQATCLYMRYSNPKRQTK
jgi:ribosomal protein S18 acetylase RimI-like enzyme